jgi:hypothetical protein
MTQPTAEEVVEHLKHLDARTEYENEVIGRGVTLIEQLTRQRDSTVRTLLNLTHDRAEDEIGPLDGPLWARVAHVLCLGSTSAIAVCREVGVDPHADPQEKGVDDDSATDQA